MYLNLIDRLEKIKSKKYKDLENIKCMTYKEIESLIVLYRNDNGFVYFYILINFFKF